MLRNVLADYLDNVNEREFDLPFLALLSAMGFYDIHYTHGPVEFGKDFIAKRQIDNIVMQFSFQLKAGDIGLADWRNTIRGQMLDCLLVGLSHPNFARDIPHQSVLVTTGRLTGNVSLGLQDLNNTIRQTYNLFPIDVWDLETLLDSFLDYGFDGLYNTTATGFFGYGNFYILYGKCLQGVITDREIENHSRQWIEETIEPNKRLLGAAIESEILAQKSVQQGLLYEATQAHLGALRAVESQLQTQNDVVELARLSEIYNQAKLRLRSSYRLYLSLIRQRWTEAEKDLVQLVQSAGGMTIYLVHCARIIEVTGSLYFIESDEIIKSDLIEFLLDFIAHESGCAHSLGDRYAVSLIPPVIALVNSRHVDVARELIRRATIWLCDHYQNGFGLASLEASEREETSILLGHPFSFIQHQPTYASFLATILCDLAAFVDGQLYSDVVNDVRACRIATQYWQAQDSIGLFQIEGADVIAYPNIEYSDTITRFDAYEFAEHIVHEPRTFRIMQTADLFALISVMLLLRDRYFPTIWPLLIQNPN
jgi:hypothetical protein